MYPRTNRSKVSIAFLSFSLLLFSTVFASAQQNAANMLSESFREAIAQVKPAVVSISAEKNVKPVDAQKQFDMDDVPDVFKRFFGEDFFRNNPYRNMSPKRDWQGSGVIISTEGEVLTNNHVVNGADSITVTLDDGRNVEADMDSVKSDPGSDLAIFKLKENGDYPYAKLGDSDSLQVGDWVLAIGSPFGLNQTVTEGIVSAKGRTSSDVQIGGEEFYVKDYIQTSAAINPGNSGGPLINLNGEIIGVNNAIQTAGALGNIGIGFAIPSNLAKSVIDSLKEFGEVRRGYVGVYLKPLESDDIAKWYKQEFGIDQGVFVESVIPDSPAEEAGLKEGDVIILFDGEKVTSPGQMINMVTTLSPGTKVELTIIRKGKRMTKNLTLAQRTQEIAMTNSQRYLGLKIETLTPEIAEALGYEKDKQGVVVAQVAPGGSADQVDIQQNDVITEVNMNGDPVTSVAQFEEILSDIVDQMKEKGEKDHLILLHIFRADRKYPDKWVAPTIRLQEETEEK
ncbi:MAG: Do family serine endopeptidase [Candidatus Omnitrophica bacterium]|nr:Do family serine endopeptidase [Candidatus Omnitrophota bacterium]